MNAAGIANNATVLKSICFHMSVALNRLLSKCTIAVRAMAISTGKKMANTGIRIVPNPKPEKKVRRAVAKAISAINRYSMNGFTENWGEGLPGKLTKTL